MTKRETRKQINKRFYEHVNEFYPNWEIDNHGDGGRYTLYNTEDKNNDNAIEYHIGNHSLCAYNNSSFRTEEILKELEIFIKLLKRKFLYK